MIARDCLGLARLWTQETGEFMERLDQVTRHCKVLRHNGEDCISNIESGRMMDGFPTRAEF